MAGYISNSESETYFAVARYNIDGSPDNTFNGNGQQVTDFDSKSSRFWETDSFAIHASMLHTVGIQANGKIVVGGYASNGNDFDFAIARYNINGSLDNTFDNDGRQTTKIGSSDDLVIH